MMVEVVPAISAAVGAYGVGVLTRAQDAAVDATVNLGQRILAWLWGHAAERGRLEAAVTDLATDGEDPDAVAALRLQVRRILAQDPELVTELAGMLPPAPRAGAIGTRSVAIAGNNTAPITTGDHSPIGDQP
jgi:hypothetical protein